MQLKRFILRQIKRKKAKTHKTKHSNQNNFENIKENQLEFVIAITIFDNNISAANLHAQILAVRSSNPQSQILNLGKSKGWGCNCSTTKTCNPNFNKIWRKKKTYGFCLCFQFVVKTEYVFPSRNVVFCVVVKIHLNKTSKKHDWMEFPTPLPMKCKSSQSWYNLKKVV